MSQVQTTRLKHYKKSDEHTNQQCRNDPPPLEFTNVAEKMRSIRHLVSKIWQKQLMNVAMFDPIDNVWLHRWVTSDIVWWGRTLSDRRSLENAIFSQNLLLCFQV
jgi:hypothetical protein